jgi:hypothetical protein
VLSYRYAYGELSVSVGLHDVALAVHYGDSVHGERPSAPLSKNLSGLAIIPE